MKKTLYILIITGCAALLSVSCSKDMLDTAPAGSLSGAEIFGDAGKAQSAVDGIYRLTRYIHLTKETNAVFSGFSALLAPAAISMNSITLVI